MKTLYTSTGITCIFNERDLIDEIKKCDNSLGNAVDEYIHNLNKEHKEQHSLLQAEFNSYESSVEDYRAFCSDLKENILYIVACLNKQRTNKEEIKEVIDSILKELDNL